jgi:hypothetical protein
MIRVYQYGLRPTEQNQDIVCSQLKAADDYRNKLAVIERARRCLLRAMLTTETLQELEQKTAAATRSTKRVALEELSKARRARLREFSEDIDRMTELEQDLRRNARQHTDCYWGTYLSEEAAADRRRAGPKPSHYGVVKAGMVLYDRDGLTPRDPRILRPRLDGRIDGQLGVQLQGGLAVRGLYAGTDTRLRIVDGHVWLRVGSDGRDPIWAVWSITKPGGRSGGKAARLGRVLPDAGVVTWARVSSRLEGPWTRWTLELTVDVRGQAHPHAIASAHEGTWTADAIAIEVVWLPEGTPEGASIRVARWRDTEGHHGAIILPARIVGGVRKSSDIRSIRDTLRADASKKILRALRESRDSLPPWLAEARNSMEYWKSPERFLALARQWRANKCDAARAAYELLDAWELRDSHLYEYETGARTSCLRHRRDIYRKLAARWSREYRHAIVEQRMLNYEARFGEESALRFIAGPSELRGSIVNAFGPDDVSMYARKEKLEGDDEREWCERAIDAWNAGGARDPIFRKRVTHAEGGAWATRKAAKAKRLANEATARNVDGKVANA